MTDVFAPGDYGLRNPNPTPRAYDPGHPLDQAWLLWWADLYRVPFSQLDALGEAMKGQPCGFFEKALAKVRKAVIPTKVQVSSPLATRDRAAALRGSLQPPRATSPVHGAPPLGSRRS